ncbi:hypothetical protein D3C74_371500 [compost metagenome]
MQSVVLRLVSQLANDPDRLLPRLGNGEATNFGAFDYVERFFIKDFKDQGSRFCLESKVWRDCQGLIANGHSSCFSCVANHERSTCNAQSPWLFGSMGNYPQIQIVVVTTIDSGPVDTFKIDVHSPRVVGSSKSLRGMMLVETKLNWCHDIYS